MFTSLINNEFLNVGISSISNQVTQSIPRISKVFNNNVFNCLGNKQLAILSNIAPDCGNVDNVSKIGDFLNFLFSPSQWLVGLWNWTFGVSYFVCALILMFCVIFTLFGHKKMKKWIPTTLFVYTLIQAIGIL